MPELRILLLFSFLFLLAFSPAALLLLLSMGDRWSYPHLLPDQFNLGPWQALFADRRAFLTALGTSLLLAFPVGLTATALGLILSRLLRRLKSPDILRAAIYLPFLLSPIIVAVCLYDLFVRLGLAGSPAGVALAQVYFASAFAAVFFSEFWDVRTDETEQLVSSLGGGMPAVWRHAVLPRAGGLILLCFFQTLLFSWLDYGLVLFIGGGRVETLTLRLFGYIREGSINLAALAGLLLLLPSIAGLLVTPLLLNRIKSTE